MIIRKKSKSTSDQLTGWIARVLRHSQNHIVPFHTIHPKKRFPKTSIAHRIGETDLLKTEWTILIGKQIGWKSSTQLSDPNRKRDELPGPLVTPKTMSFLPPQSIPGPVDKTERNKLFLSRTLYTQNHFIVEINPNYLRSVFLTD